MAIERDRFFVLARLDRGGSEAVARSVQRDAHPPGFAGPDRHPSHACRSRSHSLRDTSPRAYEKVVDRLLRSPRYGERMAARWLDAARYADTNGYQYDGERVMWRWRDWVIQAFNRNEPFNQFALEQLAGDLLPNATPRPDHRNRASIGTIAPIPRTESFPKSTPWSMSPTAWTPLRRCFSAPRSAARDATTTSTIRSRRKSITRFSRISITCRNWDALISSATRLRWCSRRPRIRRRNKMLWTRRFGAARHRSTGRVRVALRTRSAGKSRLRPNVGRLRRDSRPRNLPASRKYSTAKLLSTCPRRGSSISKIAGRFPIWVRPDASVDGSLVSRMQDEPKGKGYGVHLDHGKVHVNLTARGPTMPSASKRNSPLHRTSGIISR